MNNKCCQQTFLTIFVYFKVIANSNGNSYCTINCQTYRSNILNTINVVYCFCATHAVLYVSFVYVTVSSLCLNRFAMFQNVRIPQENLLNKTGDITPDGRYVTPFKVSAGFHGWLKKTENQLQLM